MTSPPRAWCVVVRASDRRINSGNALIEFEPQTTLRLNEATDEAVARGVEHIITIDGRLIRQLTAPVTIPWPGIPKSEATLRLGARSLNGWLRAGTIKLWGHDAPSQHGHKGKPVPIVYTPSPVDPCSGSGRPPVVIWGTFWQWRQEKIPENFLLRAKRVPRWGKFKGLRMPLGWDWICPGRLVPHRIPLSDRGGAKNSTSQCDAIEEAALDQDQFDAVPCGRRARFLYGPLPIWTLPRALGQDLALELPPESGLTGTWHPGIEDPLAGLRSFACNHCWKVRGTTLSDRSGWNQIVAHLTGGLLHGYEVQRPADEAPRQRRRIRFRKRMNPSRARWRAQLTELLMLGLTCKQIARRTGLGLRCVESRKIAIYREHGVRTRAELARKLGRPVPPSLVPPPPHLAPRRRIVLKLRLAGLSLRQIAAELKINIKTAHSDVIALRGQGKLQEPGVSSPPPRCRLTFPRITAAMLA